MKNLEEIFKVEYEDNHLIVVNKSSGVLVQGDITEDLPLTEYVKEYLKRKYNKPGNVFVGLVHRLDRPVSGLVLLAKTSKALERMNEQMRNKEIKKVYWAVVKKQPPRDEATLVHWLVKNSEKNITTAYKKEGKNALHSELSYKILGNVADHYLLEVRPITGRPHQIRVQLASEGCPIRGDVKYGAPTPNVNGSINLHARKLSFLHPVKKEPLTIFGSLPRDSFWNQFKIFE